MKKLILTLFIFLGLHPLIKAQNVLDMQSWTVGTGTTGAFNQNGKTIENERIWGEGPQGQRAVLWEAKPEGNSDDDGGFNHSSFAIDHTKMYRFSIWLKKTNSTDGISYFGTENVNDLNGGSHWNPYFWYGDLPELNKWYLLVAYVHGSGDISAVNYGGIYDSSNGAKVANTIDFQFPVGAATTYIRSYLYYDPNVNDRQYFYAPRVEVVNGEEPSIEALLALSTNSLKNSLGLGTAAYLNADVNAVPGTAVQRNGNGFIYASYFNMSAPAVDGTPFTDLVTTNGEGFLRRNSSAAVKSFLSTSLQDVTGIGNNTTNNIKINSFQNAIPELGALNYKLYLANDDNGYGMQFGVLSIGDGYIQQQRGDGGATAYNLLFNPSGGNVGIGTTLPSERLTVNGKIKAKEIKVDGAGAPDYVFEDSYKVATLEELESYIKANKHLPEVPSATEFERDGIAVGEMNKLLLKKIEELTLHLIEKDKELSQEKELNKVQNDRLKNIEASQNKLEALLKQLTENH